MAVPTSANLVFLPWVRQGAAAGIRTPDRSLQQAGAVSVTVSLRINQADTVERRVRLYGPGDVTGIDPRQVIRTEPRHLATDVEPNYFPAIEFDRPDFPWLFTPGMADAAGTLRPWLCLVVVRKQAGVALRAAPGLPLPVLEIGAPARPDQELPDLAESWAWAHVQVAGAGPDPAALRAALGGDPALSLSRLLCFRRLDPLTDYLACLVPAFELGCKAGLGRPITSEDERVLRPAWGADGQIEPELTLPVYYHWDFRTGTGGDFEALVRLLEPRDAGDVPAQVGKRPVDISRPGFPVTPPPAPGTTVELEGALRLADAPAAAWPDATRRPWQTGLATILNAAGRAMEQAGAEPLLAPPVYGRWLAARHTVDLPSAAPDLAPWLDQLNLDPRHRAIAAVGTAVVQAQQEQLMAAAWEQLGDIERINRLRRQAQLARAVNTVYHGRHFARFAPEMLLNVVAPAQTRVAVAEPGGDRMFLARRIAESAIPARAVAAPLRHLASSRGVISTRFQQVRGPQIAMLVTLNTALHVLPAHQPAGLATLNQVGERQRSAAAQALGQIARFERAAAALDAAPPIGDFTIAPEDTDPPRSLLAFTPGAADSPDAQAFRDAAKAHHAYLTNALMGMLTFPAPPPMDLAGTRQMLLHSLDPRRTISARVQATLRTGDGAAPPDDGLAPILDGPEFPQPMYEAVRDISQALLFPGLEHVPANSVMLLKTNPQFVESFMVGLNTEMSRELLWRNFPTDQRSTCFRQFWDTSAGSGELDIEPIHRWAKAGPLGTNVQAGEQLVLLLRGELLRRYPNAVIYAASAVLVNGQFQPSQATADERHPIFRGTLEPDVTFVGFDLTRTAAIADPGWYFVLQQQPTEPRFGLDIADFTKPPPPLTTWDELSWRHLAETEAQLSAIAYVSTAAPLPAVDRATWGTSSAHQAYITLQRPVRIAIHARELIVKGGL